MICNVKKHSVYSRVTGTLNKRKVHKVSINKAAVGECISKLNLGTSGRRRDFQKRNFDVKNKFM